VVAENNHLSSPELPEGNTIKETNFKETNLRKPLYSPPKGDTNVTEEKKVSVKKKSDDSKMSQYLRPSTLFGTKADDYLQVAIQAGGNLEDPEAYAKNQPNYQPGRIPKTPREKVNAAIERVFVPTNTTLDPDGKPINPLFRNPEDYTF
jgi:uncharacterized phage protein (TIGR02220 family)